MKKTVCLILLSTIIGCNTDQFNSYNIENELTLSVDSIMNASYPADEPGAAIIITKEGEELYKKGFGLASVEFNVPMKPEMIFRLGSMTKQFTAVSILMLEEQGKLSVNDDIRIHLPDYPTHGAIITIENLLTNTSGIPCFRRFENVNEIERKHLTTDDILSLFKDKPLEFNPGDRFSYSNSGYNLLGAIIERVSGMSYEDFVEKNIFQRLGMSNSFYDRPEEVRQNKVPGYVKDSIGYKFADYMTMCAPFSAGGLRSNVIDLALWNKAIHEGELLPLESLEKAFIPVKLNTGESHPYGYGWFTHSSLGHKMYSHGGDINGFRTSGIYFPEEEIFIAILSNNFSSYPVYLSVLLSYKLLDIKFDQYSITDEELEKYTGTYQYNFEITFDSTGLFLSSPWREKLIPINKNEFLFEEQPLSATFQLDSEDSVESITLIHLFRGEEFTARRIKH